MTATMTATNHAVISKIKFKRETIWHHNAKNSIWLALKPLLACPSFNQLAITTWPITSVSTTRLHCVITLCLYCFCKASNQNTSSELSWRRWLSWLIQSQPTVTNIHGQAVSVQRFVAYLKSHGVVTSYANILILSLIKYAQTQTQ